MPNTNRYSRFNHLNVDVDEEGIAIVRFAPVDDDDIEASFFHEAGEIFIPLNADPNVQAVVLTGATADHFVLLRPSVLDQLQRADLHTVAGRLLAVQRFAHLMLTFRKPVVAAVNGHARAIGAGLALLADAAIASESTTFSDLHVARGLAGGDGGTMFWPLLVGISRAREILLFDDELSAQEALDLHIVRKVVPQADVLPTSIALARELAELPRLAYMATKLALNNWFRLSSLISWDMASAYEAAGILLSENEGSKWAAAQYEEAGGETP